MRTASIWLVTGVVVSMLVSACGEEDKKAAAEIPFADVRTAMDGGEDAFRSFVETTRGTQVRWSGIVTETVRARGDDYIELAFLLVDFDAPGQGSPDADVIFEIKPSSLDAFQAGDSVTVAGIIRELERHDRDLLLKLELKEVTKTAGG
ncbi:MAG: hypothetical protein ACFCUO_04415 [Rhodospirillales bacterium]